jgi:hypothetical protein
VRPRVHMVERAASSSMRLHEVEGATPKKKAHPRHSPAQHFFNGVAVVRPPSEEDDRGFIRQEKSSAARPVRPPPASPPPRRSRIMAAAQEEERAGTHPSTKVVDDKNDDRKKKDQEDKKKDVKKEKRKDDVKKDVKKDNTKKEKPKKEGKVPQARGTVKTKSASTCGQEIGTMIEIHQKDLSCMLRACLVKKKKLREIDEKIRFIGGPIAQAQAKIKWLESERADHEKEIEAQVGDMEKKKALLELCKNVRGSYMVGAENKRSVSESSEESAKEKEACRSSKSSSSYSEESAKTKSSSAKEYSCTDASEEETSKKK